MCITKNAAAFNMSSLFQAEQPAPDPVVPVQQYNIDRHRLQSSSDDDNASYDVLYAQTNWDDATSDKEPVVPIDDLIQQLVSSVYCHVLQCGHESTSQADTGSL